MSHAQSGAEGADAVDGSAASNVDSIEGGTGRGRFGVMDPPPVGKEGYGLKGGAGEYDPAKPNGSLGEAADGTTAKQEKRGVFDLPRGGDGKRMGPAVGDAFLFADMPQGRQEVPLVNGPLQEPVGVQTGVPEARFGLPIDKALPYGSLKVSVRASSEQSEGGPVLSPIPTSQPVPAFKDAAVSRTMPVHPIAARQVAVSGSVLGPQVVAVGGSGFGGLDARAPELGCNETVPAEESDPHASIENLLESLMSQDGGHSYAGNHISDGGVQTLPNPAPVPVLQPKPAAAPDRQQWAEMLEAGQVALTHLPVPAPSAPVAQRSSPFGGGGFGGAQLPQGYTFFPTLQGLPAPQVAGGNRVPQQWLSGMPLAAKPYTFVQPGVRDGLYDPQAGRGGLSPQGGGNSAFAPVRHLEGKGSGGAEKVPGPLGGPVAKKKTEVNSSDEEVPIGQMGEKRRVKKKKPVGGAAVPKPAVDGEKPKKKRVRKPKPPNGEAAAEGANGALAGVKQGDLPKKKRKPVVKKPVEPDSGQNVGVSEDVKEGEETGAAGGGSGASTPDGKRVIKKTQKLLEGEESNLFRLPSIQGGQASIAVPKKEVPPGQKRERKKKAPKAAEGGPVKKPKPKKPVVAQEVETAAPADRDEKLLPEGENTPPPEAAEQGPDPAEESLGPFEIAAFRRKRSDVTPKKRFDGSNLEVSLSVPIRKKRSQNEVGGQSQARKKRKTLPLAVQEALAESEQEASPEPEPLEIGPEAEQEPEAFNKDRCS